MTEEYYYIPDLFLLLITAPVMYAHHRVACLRVGRKIGNLRSTAVGFADAMPIFKKSHETEFSKSRLLSTYSAHDISADTEMLMEFVQRADEQQAQKLIMSAHTIKLRFAVRERTAK